MWNDLLVTSSVECCSMFISLLSNFSSLLFCVLHHCPIASCCAAFCIILCRIAFCCVVLLLLCLPVCLLFCCHTVPHCTIWVLFWSFAIDLRACNTSFWFARWLSHVLDAHAHRWCACIIIRTWKTWCGERGRQDARARVLTYVLEPKLDRLCVMHVARLVGRSLKPSAIKNVCLPSLAAGMWFGKNGTCVS